MRGLADQHDTCRTDSLEQGLEVGRRNVREGLAVERDRTREPGVIEWSRPGRGELDRLVVRAVRCPAFLADERHEAHVEQFLGLEFFLRHPGDAQQFLGSPIP